MRGTGAPKRIRGEAYFGWRIPEPGATDDPLFLRLYLSPQGTRLNLPGHPDGLIAAPERDANGTLQPGESGKVQAPERAARALLTTDGWQRWINVRASNGLSRYTLLISGRLSFGGSGGDSP